MKTYKRIITIVSILATLVSCNKYITNFEVPNDMTYEKTIENTYIYRENPEFTYDGSEKNESSNIETAPIYDDRYINIYPNDQDIYMNINDVLYSYKVSSGVLIAMCMNPSCDHESYSCPFSNNIDNCIFYDNKVFGCELVFEENEKAIKQYYYYDINKLNKVNLRTSEMGYSIITKVYNGGFVYYYDLVVDKESGEWLVTLCRQNINNLKIEKLASQNGFNTEIVFIHDNRVYFRDLSYKKLFYCDISDFSTREYIIDSNTDLYTLCEDGFYYLSEDLQGKVSLWFTDYNGSKPEMIIDDNIGRYSFANGNIYYITRERTEVDKNYSISSRYIKVFNVSERKVTKNIDLDEVARGISVENFAVKGNYIYANINYYDNETGFVACLHEGVLRIHEKTLQWYYISPKYNK